MKQKNKKDDFQKYYQVLIRKHVNRKRNIKSWMRK